MPNPKTWKTEYLLPVVFVAVHSALVLVNIWANSPVIDEPYHIASGLSHYYEHNFLADQVNPPLARMIAVIPLLPAHPAYDRTRIKNETGVRSEWKLGDSWVKQNGAAVVWQTRMARLAGVGWSILGAGLIYRLVARHHGKGSATLALALWCFDPTIIGLAAIATADLPAAVAALGAASAYDALLDADRKKSAWSKRLQAGLWLGLALLTKFTLLILPLYWLIWCIGRWLGSPRQASQSLESLKKNLRDWLVVCFVALVVVNAGYGFQGSFRQLEDFRFVSTTFAGPLPEEEGVSVRGTWGNRFRGTILGRLPIPVPKDLVIGIDVQRRDFEHPFPSYLDGHWSGTGWWWFYIYAMALKEPIPWLCLLNLAILRRLSRIGTRSADNGTAWLEGLGLILFTFVSAQTGFSHHMRYVLPAYPFIFVFIARYAATTSSILRPTSLPIREVGNRRPPFLRSSIAIPSLICWMMGAAIISTPNCLSHFNLLCGGSKAGHRHLLYSNCDWGQGLLQFKQWIKDHPEAVPLHVSYMGSIDPSTLGIEAPPVPPYSALQRAPSQRKRRQDGPAPGYYALSATVLHSPDGDLFRGFLDSEPDYSIGGSILIYQIQ